MEKQTKNLIRQYTKRSVNGKNWWFIFLITKEMQIKTPICYLLIGKE